MTDDSKLTWEEATKIVSQAARELERKRIRQGEQQMNSNTNEWVLWSDGDEWGFRLIETEVGLFITVGFGSTDGYGVEISDEDINVLETALRNYRLNRNERRD